MNKQEKVKKGARSKTGPYKTKADRETRESFGFRMMQARKQKGWTQAQLAVASDYDVRVISRYEIDGATPSIEAAVRIAKALEVSLDVLGGISASPPPVDAQLHALMQQCLRPATGADKRPETAFKSVGEAGVIWQ